jgi:hypothetical protein
LKPGEEKFEIQGIAIPRHDDLPTNFEFAALWECGREVEPNREVCGVDKALDLFPLHKYEISQPSTTTSPPPFLHCPLIWPLYPATDYCCAWCFSLFFFLSRQPTSTLPFPSIYSPPCHRHSSTSITFSPVQSIINNYSLLPACFLPVLST